MHMMYFSVYFNEPGYLCKLCERCLQGYSPSRYGHAQPQGDLLDVSIIFFFLYLSVQDIVERDLLNFYEENVSIFRAKKRLREAENKRRNRNRRYENV